MTKEEPHPQCPVGLFSYAKYILIKCYQHINNFKKYNIPPDMDEALGLDIENILNSLTFLRKIILYSNSYTIQFIKCSFVI